MHVYDDVNKMGITLKSHAYTNQLFTENYKAMRITKAAHNERTYNTEPSWCEHDMARRY